MRILVADDEALVRYSLVSILEDLLVEPPTILEAANGRDMVELTRKTRPHIGFIDIRMPKMDGLQAIAEARKYAPRTLWVIVSGYGDFENARDALKLGVEDFLLKPADPEEVKKLLGKLVDKARERQRRGNRELEAKVSAVLGNTSAPEFDSWFAKPRFWQAGMVLWDSLLPDTDIALRKRQYANLVQGILDGEDDYSGCVLSFSGEALLVVLAMPAGSLPMDKVIGLWSRRFENLRLAARDVPGKDIGDTWLLTRVVQDPAEMFREIDDSGKGSCLRFVSRPADLLKYRDLTARVGTASNLAAAELLEEMRNTYRYGSEDDFHGLAHRLTELLDQQNEPGAGEGGSSWYCQYGIPLSVPFARDLKTLAVRLHDESHDIFTGREPGGLPDNGGATLAHRALSVMNRRYRETIGIAQVAEELGVTANYLSTLFKKEVGMGFTHKLTDLRLAKAKDLLSRPNANIGEIAQSLGYQSSRHFTRLFKDRFGVTPSVWTTAKLDR